MKIKLFITALMTMLIFSTFSVMAAESPTAATYYTITVNGQTISANSSSTQKVAGGTITVSVGSVKEGNKVTLTAKANDGKSFKKWALSGNYTIVSGSLKDNKITIIPKDNIDVKATFVDGEGNEIPETTVVPGSKPSDNDSSTSPKTGIPVLPFATVLLLASSIAIISSKKLAK